MFACPHCPSSLEETRAIAGGECHPNFETYNRKLMYTDQSKPTFLNKPYSLVIRCKSTHCSDYNPDQTSLFKDISKEIAVTSMNCVDFYQNVSLTKDRILRIRQAQRAGRKIKVKKTLMKKAKRKRPLAKDEDPDYSDVGPQSD